MITKMNKKGIAFQASIWFILLVIYFAFFISIVYSVENLTTEININDDSAVDIRIDGVNIQGTIGSSYCSEPRYKYDAVTGDTSIHGANSKGRLLCSESHGVLSETECLGIEGCSWDAITTGYWFWETTANATCLGIINSTYYGVAQTDPLIGSPKVADHNATSIWSEYTPFASATPCNHENVVYNQNSCEVFDCSWQSLTVDNIKLNPASIWSTVGSLFTFSYDFGFTNPIIVFIMNIIFVVIPALMLLLILYNMIPLI